MSTTRADAEDNRRPGADPAGSESAVEAVGPPPAAQLPAVVSPDRRPRMRQHFRRRWLLAGLVPAAAVLGYWWFSAQPALPPGIAFGNGRLEADEVAIATKFAGRIAKLFVDEGDLVRQGQVVAMMDTQDLAATLRKNEALADAAQHALDEARANFAQQQTQVTFARQELDRSSALVSKGFATVEQLDQRRQLMAAATAGLAAADQRVNQAQHARNAARHDVELYRVNILDNTLVAPKEGPIEYRVANIGEVLPAGGKVFTLLDASYVYMDIYLPTAEAGRVRLGSDARIVLDAYPDHAIRAKVVFVAKEAQFTPKAVETKDERDKLMFRIRVRIDPELLKGRAGLVRSGLPGIAYVRTSPNTPWPPRLQSGRPSS
jgi:HlyD family secretion protein